MQRLFEQADLSFIPGLDHFYLYLTPNPAVVELEHYFLCLSFETRQWRRIYLNGPQFVNIIEVHMTVNRDEVMVLDYRNMSDERNIHRIPLRYVHKQPGHK